MSENGNKSIQNFYSTILGKESGGVRFNHEFLISVTDFPNQASLQYLNNIQFLARSSNLPTWENGTVPAGFMGVSFELPTQYKQSTTLQLNLVSDSNLKLYQSFFDWSNLVAQFQLNQDSTELENGFGTKTDNYNTVKKSFAKFELQLLSHDLETVIGRYTLHGCYPKTVGNYSLSHETAAIAVFDVTINFLYWNFETLNTEPYLNISNLNDFSYYKNGNNQTNQEQPTSFLGNIFKQASTVQKTAQSVSLLEKNIKNARSGSIF